ncbi:citrate synthase [Halalkalibacterium halodurans]|jgi:citrate synthase|uniref:Citrate synthase n=2 Tax=Halalkalibacterium halodurans TaxID=86665 RepID=Q9K847_HALH5|nr:citrate synthase [Halalkalibacterium halodurans]MDY7223693.1 citrate synthase [Halalkalibacterium halodurans]MDY7242914.1 citrate synthase [Halalkalibacterium halodurans]MED4082142.1 citrate synthase [Halalkalibacterium halodurans]MED4084280.1 citrate synthase [Halalkalibacterium halodurans]MED4103589.1 citrate synthase [Halalkalibacterium halodurans]
MSVTRGLEGVVATTSSVSSIIESVLTYQGYDIDELAEHASFEEVIYLLWNGKLPNKVELKELADELANNAEIPQEVIEQMKAYPLDRVHPMGALRTAISSLGLYDEEADLMDEAANKRKALKLQAQVSTVVTAFSRIREGKEPVAPRTDLSFAANFLYMLTGEEPDEIAVDAFNKALVLHADHELNASTFTARVCVATLSDVYSGITAAIGALKGPLHGGANEQVMAMLTEIGDVENVEPYIRKALDNKQKIMGFGHRVYKNGDPRAKHLREMSKKLTSITGESKWYEMSVKIEEIVTNEKGLLPNVDFYSASVYHSLGIKHDLFTPIFAVSRMSGWLAHILEQYSNNRLIRPRAEYVGPNKRQYVRLEERN